MKIRIQWISKIKPLIVWLSFKSRFMSGGYSMSYTTSRMRKSSPNHYILTIIGKIKNGSPILPSDSILIRY